ncbi:MAG: hypothetical protein R2702_11635 [Acidimicrobiales bacterium]
MDCPTPNTVEPPKSQTVAVGLSTSTVVRRPSTTTVRSVVRSRVDHP